MASSFDFDVLPIHRREGQDQPAPPGLHLATPPRRAIRSRKDDRLIIWLTLTGSATFPAEGYSKLLAGLARSYYRTAGSVTSALRTACESFNHFLLDRNLRVSSSGLQAIGLLTILVVHRDGLYIAQAGPTHVFSIGSKGVQHLHDRLLSGHGLGLGKTATVRYSHVGLEPGSLVILSPQPPHEWEEAILAKAFGRPIEAVHRGLLRKAGPDLLAVVIRTRPGKGKLRLMEPLSSPVISTSKEPAAEDSQLKLKGEPPLAHTQKAENEDVTREQPPGIPVGIPTPLERPEARGTLLSSETLPPVNIPEPARGRGAGRKPAVLTGIGERTEGQPAPEANPAGPPATSRKSRRKPVVGPMIMAVARAFGHAASQLGQSLRALISNLLPGTELFTIPSSVMLFVAVAVPVLIVTIASVVYLQRGLVLQYDAYFQQAEAAALNARGKSDPREMHANWEAVIFYVDKAESYQVTDESTGLRAEALSVLDQLDYTGRLDFQPAIADALPRAVSVRKMVAENGDLYLLDETSGGIIRTFRTGRGYEFDPTFRCGPGSYGSYIVEKLIDLAPLPKNNSLEASLIAMDANGILIYCIPGKPLLASPLAPPDSNWGNPLAFTLDSGVLYVLDPKTNAVWMYTGEDYSFVKRPSLYFNEEVPPMLDVIDLAVNEGDLFLLHEDGHITMCTVRFGDQPTRCTEPAFFTDSRPGRQDGITVEGTHFTQITFTPPPDPSIYLLDPDHQSVYHFSLRLTLQRQYRPADLRLAQEPVTAFAVSPNRNLFVAFGNEVFMAAFP